MKKSLSICIVLLIMLSGCTYTVNTASGFPTGNVENVIWEIENTLISEAKIAPTLFGSISIDTWDQVCVVGEELLNGKQYTEDVNDIIELPDSSYVKKVFRKVFTSKDGSCENLSVGYDKNDTCVEIYIQYVSSKSEAIRRVFIPEDDESKAMGISTMGFFQSDHTLVSLDLAAAKKQCVDFLSKLGFSVSQLRVTTYALDSDSLQSAADFLLEAGWYDTPPSEEWIDGKTLPAEYRTYCQDDECYYISVEFSVGDIPLYSSDVGLSDGTNYGTMEKLEGENPVFGISGPSCAMIIDKDGISYLRLSTMFTSLEENGDHKELLSTEAAQSAFAALYENTIAIRKDEVQDMHLYYIPVYDAERMSFSYSPVWEFEIYTYKQPDDPDRFSIKHVFIDAYTGKERYPSVEEAPASP